MLTLVSPAKINLFLRIIRRRQDGYHELASLFQTIDLCDTIHFSLANCDVLTCNDSTTPTDHSNLIFKALSLFRRKTGLKINLSVHLEKRIPQQAGLGGGSSNAATTLWALNQLCDKPVMLNELVAWSAEIGSDIPFFLSEGTAYCTGRGEIFRQVKPLAKTSLYIAKPSQGLSTPQVYGKLDLSCLLQRDPEAALAAFFTGCPVYFNDLETPAFAVLPELTILKSHLQSLGFSEVMMSGSGSAFFCLGNGVPESLPGVAFYHANFINRSTDSWYTHP